MVPAERLTSERYARGPLLITRVAAPKLQRVASAHSAFQPCSGFHQPDPVLGARPFALLTSGPRDDHGAISPLVLKRPLSERFGNPFQDQAELMVRYASDQNAAGVHSPLLGGLAQ